MAVESENNSVEMQNSVDLDNYSTPTIVDAGNTPINASEVEALQMKSS